MQPAALQLGVGGADPAEPGMAAGVRAPARWGAARRIKLTHNPQLIAFQTHNL
jgi:hypothetical protein